MKESPSVNVLLTSVCPNTCPYCFASGYLAPGTASSPQFMQLEDFRRVLAFLGRSRVENIRLLGGEPMIHPEIEAIFGEIRKHDWVSHITVFTGGLFNPRLVQVLADRDVSVLLNANHPRDYRKQQFARFKATLVAMTDQGVSLTLGFNIYEPACDVGPIMTLCHDHQIRSLRLCVANPNPYPGTRTLSLSERRSVGATLFAIVSDCATRGINVFFDCIVTPCMFTDAQWGAMTKLFPHITGNLGQCCPSLDIDPQLNVRRCFGFGPTPGMSLVGAHTTEDLNEFFLRSIDQYKVRAHLKECEDCAYLRHGSCQGDCLAFRSSEIRSHAARHRSAQCEYSQARAALTDGRLEQAVVHFEQAMAAYPYDASMISEYAYAMIKVGRFEVAREIVGKHEQEVGASGGGEWCFVKAVLAELSGLKEEALANYLYAMKKVSDQGRAHIERRIRQLKVELEVVQHAAD